MTAATKAQLRARVRIEADMVVSRFLADTSVDQFVLDEYKALYDLVCASGVDYFLGDPTSFTVSSGNTAALPSDFYKLVAIDKDEGGGDWVELMPFQFHERNLAGSGSTNVLGTYRIWYWPKLSALSADGTSILSVLEPWEEYIVLGAAAKCLVTEESDPSPLVAKQAAVASRIMVSAPNRDVGAPDRIQDVTVRDVDSVRYRLVGTNIYLYNFASPRDGYASRRF